MLVREIIDDETRIADVDAESRDALSRLRRQIERGEVSDSTSQLDLTMDELVQEYRLVKMWRQLERVQTAPDAKRRLAEYRTKFEESFRKNPSYATQWYLADVLEAEAEYKLALELRPTKATSQTELKERCEFFVHSFRRQLDMVRATSRSTSQLANLCEDVEHAVKCRVFAQLSAALNGEYLS